MTSARRQLGDRAEAIGRSERRTAAVRIVLIDDTPDFRLLLRVALESEPSFTVVAEAADGAAGVAAVERHQPDVVLLDLAMPILDGIDALPQIKRISPNSQVIILSGFEIGRMGRQAQHAGAAAYLQKGTAAREIVAAVAGVLGLTRPIPSANPDPELVAKPVEEPFVRPISESDGPEPAVALQGDGRLALGAEGERMELHRIQTALATVAHELRSPAITLAGLAQTLRRAGTQLDPATVEQLLDAIVRQSMVVDRVTLDLLASSQSERDVLQLDIAPIELVAAVRAAVVAVSDRGSVTVDSPHEVWVAADSVRVQQMLTNLLSNAMKYGASPRTAVVSVSAGHAEVRICDAGPGVPVELRPRLFDQYTRAAGARAGGMGIGLYVVRSLAQAQGGRSWHRAPAGGGSEFGFSLPLSDEPGTASNGAVSGSERMPDE